MLRLAGPRRPDPAPLAAPARGRGLRPGWGRRASRDFRRDRAGVSAVEFALVMPIMLLLLAGLAETGHALDNWRKVTLLSRTVADLTSQGDPNGAAVIPSATMTDILAAAKAVIRPFDATKVKIVVSAMGVDLTSSPLHPKVCSSTANGSAKARTTGPASDLPIPVGFNLTGERYVLAEVSMDYAPMLGSTLVNLSGGTGGAFTLTASFPWPTRGGQSYGGSSYTEVILPSGTKCP